MDASLVVAIIIAAVIAVLLTVVGGMLARRRRPRDEFLRAGESPAPTSADAVERATRMAAWMRPSGGGGV